MINEISTPDELRNTIRELEMCAEEIEFQARTARQILQGVDRRLVSQADAYWLPSIVSNVTNEHEWVGGGSMITLADAIEDLQQRLDEMENPDDESFEELRDIEFNEFISNTIE